MAVWLIPSFITLLLYGLGQGFVKKWSDDVPPALFCLFLLLARGIVNIGFFLTQEHPPPFTAEGMAFLAVGILAYILDGLGWILYFESIVYGPITIVGTLSATYPALTLLFAQIFLKEQLVPLQYMGVAMVLLGCLGLSYSPPDPDGKTTSRRWIPLAITALICWGAAQTLLKYSYSLPTASESNMALYATFGGALTLGVYGAFKLLRARRQGLSGPAIPFLHSFLPMAMMASGDLGVIIASKTGPASIVAPLTGAYPLVTLGFAAVVLKEHISRLQWACLVILLAGIGFSTIPQPPAPAETAPVQNVPVAPSAG
ncbi:MAG: DMT family transporter [Candidatus Sericytochromatia bacterium]